VAAGSRRVDRTIHKALSLPGEAPDYTTDPAAAALLVPVGFEVADPQHSAHAVYVMIRRSGLLADGLRHPHHGAWGRTVALATAGAALRAWAMSLQG